MYMPSIAKDLLKSSEAPAEKSLTRKWIDRMTKQLSLDDADSTKKSDEQLLKMISDKIGTLVSDSKEYNELKSAMRVVDRFNRKSTEPHFGPPFGYCYPGCGHW